MTVEGTGTRTMHLRYVLTLPGRPGAAWVNDDVILNRPTVAINC